MTSVTAWGLLAIALALVVALGLYAWRLWREVKRREERRNDEIRRANDNCLESLEIIAGAMLSGQVDLTEGGLRCKVLLEIIDPALLERSAFQAFSELHQRTAHLQTHSARQALSPRQRMLEDRQRLAVEEDMRERLLEAARGVIDFKQRWPASLH